MAPYNHTEYAIKMLYRQSIGTLTAVQIFSES